MKRFLSYLTALALVLALAAGSAFAAEDPEASDIVGTKDAHSYANEFLGIMAAFDDGWYVLNDEETVQAMGYVVDSLKDQALADQLRSSGLVCDLYALALDNSGDNINIQIEDLGRLYGLVMSEDVYYKKAAPQLQTALERMGISNISISQETIAFAGAEHCSCLISGEYNGIGVYERLVMVKAGDYMATVTAFSRTPGRADDLLQFFAAFDAAENAA